MQSGRREVDEWCLEGLRNEGFRKGWFAVPAAQPASAISLQGCSSQMCLSSAHYIGKKLSLKLPQVIGSHFFFYFAALAVATDEATCVFVTDKLEDWYVFYH